MNLLWTLIIGFMIGLVAKFLMPGRDPGGFIITILLGIGGAMFASWAGGALGLYPSGQPVGFIAAVLGAMGLLLIYRMIANNRRA